MKIQSSWIGALAALACLGCGGLDRDAAAELIRTQYFGTGSGRSFVILLPPAAHVETLAYVGTFAVATGDCGTRTLGWGTGRNLSCIQALNTSGFVSSCGTARPGVPGGLVGLAPGPCEPFAPGPSGTLSTATFSESALTPSACEAFLDASAAAASDAYDDHRAARDVGLSISIPGAAVFDAVTGITDSADGAKLVDFTWHLLPEAVEPLTARPCILRDSLDLGARTSRATVRRYDDGWRVENVAP